MGFPGQFWAMVYIVSFALTVAGVLIYAKATGKRSHEECRHGDEND